MGVALVVTVMNSEVVGNTETETVEMTFGGRGIRGEVDALLSFHRTEDEKVGMGRSVVHTVVLPVSVTSSVTSSLSQIVD